MNHLIDMTTTSGCVAFLIDMRIGCRRIIKVLDWFHDMNIRDQRQARKFRETRNSFLIRRAETLEDEAKRRSDSMQELRDLMVKFGGELMDSAGHIDAAIPQPLLLDLMNVNTADRRDISPSYGFTEIVYVKCLEDSAMYRGCGWRNGPLAQAIEWFMSHELIHNEQLKQAAHEHLFGKGGMFEFLPKYIQDDNGEMVRMSPKLRLADECDSKNVA